MIKLLKFLCVTLLLSGCATQVEHSAPSAGYEAPAVGSRLLTVPALKLAPAMAAFSRPRVEKAVVIPFRRFLLNGKGQNVLRDSVLKSFVVFTHRPSGVEEVQLYQSVCNQWVADFETYESALQAASYLKHVVLTPFYWPTADKEVKSGDCTTLYNYDYAFAAAVTASIGRAANTAGPLLVLQQDSEWLTLDLSKFETTDVQRAFLIWKAQIASANPLGTKFSFVKFREYFRTLVNVYGESIARYVKV